MHINLTAKKISLFGLIFFISNILLITMTMYQECCPGKAQIILETAVFILMALAMAAVFFIQPLRLQKQNLICGIAAILLTVLTIGFWGFFIARPIWRKW